MIAERNINNLGYADDTTLMGESEEELKNLLMKMRVESEKVGLKLNIQKTKIKKSGPITSREIDGQTVETVSDFIFLGSKITADGDCSHEIKRCLLLGRKVMTDQDNTPVYVQYRIQDAWGWCTGMIQRNDMGRPRAGALVRRRPRAGALVRRRPRAGALVRRRPRAGALGAAERSYPTSEVRERGLECQAVMAQERPRGATLRPRSGAAAGRRHPTSEVSSGREDTRRVRGQGGGPEELPRTPGQWRLGRDTPRLRSGATGRSHLAPEARGDDPEEPPQAQGPGRQLGGAIQARGHGRQPEGATRGVVAAQAQEGLEDLSHVEGQEWQR
ncbi:hypothetical protein AB1E19_015116 [Capra hircus]